MAKRFRELPSKIPIDMTAMIDVVFQLLTFFMLSIKAVVVEGDFNIRMPLGAGAGNPDDLVPPIVVKMMATPDGHLSDVKVGGKGAVGRDLLDALAGADATLEAAMKSGPGNGPQMAAARKAKQRVTDQLTAIIQQQVISALGGDPSRAEHTELELDCDPALRYDHVINAITAASGIVEGDQIVPLIQKIKFSPPKKAQ